MENNFRNTISPVVKKLSKKYRVSKWVFLVVSIALIVMSAFNSLLSAYAIAKNPNLQAVWFFVAIAFITAIMAFLTSVATIFAFQNKSTQNLDKIKKLDEILAQIDNKTLELNDELVESIANIDIVE